MQKELRQSALAAYEAVQKWNGRVKLELWLMTYWNAYLKAEQAKLPQFAD